MVLFFSTILISLVEKVCLFLLLVVLLMRFAVSIYMFLSLVLVTFFYGNWDYGKNIRCTLIFFL